MENIQTQNQNKLPDKWTVFVDGSCDRNPGRAGFGGIIANAQGVTELGGKLDLSTNNRAELQAAISALGQLDGTPGFVTVYSDSEHLVKGITSWIYKWKLKQWMKGKGDPVKNRDLWEALDSLVSARVAAGYSVEWKHVRAHAGIAGNERADQIATAFASGRAPDLYDGTRSEYGHDLEDLSPHPEKASPRPMPSFKSRYRVQAPAIR